MLLIENQADDSLSLLGIQKNGGQKFMTSQFDKKG